MKTKNLLIAPLKDGVRTFCRTAAFLIFNLSFLISYAQTFQKYYDRDFGTNNSIGELGHSVQQTSDGGYIAVGTSDNYGIGLKDVYVVRLNSNGDTLWTKLYGNAGGNDMARCVIQTSDGGFAIAGETQSGSGGIDAVILKIDSMGNLMWSKAFGGSGNDLGHSIIEMNDSGFVLAGQALSYSGTGYDEIFLVKVDKNGNFIWAKTLNGGGGEVARGIAKTVDGGFVISGEENSFTYGVFIAKFNMNGDTSWCKGYRAAYSSYEGYGITQTADGGFIMAANTYGGSIGSKDMVALKVTSTGSVSWTREYGTINSDQATDIIQTNDGGYVISGTATPGGTYSDMVLAKINASGILQWSKNYSGEYGTTYSMDARFQVIQTNDNGFMATGSLYNNFGNTLPALYNGYDMMLVKTDSSGGGLSTGCVKNANLQSASVTWTAFSAPFTVTAVNPTVTNSVFTQKVTAGNTDDVAIKINMTTTPVSCGACDGSAKANPCDSAGWYCSGKNPYSYLWSGTPNQSTQTATGLCFGNVTVTVTDFIGCVGIETAVISSGALPQVICLVTVDSTSTKNVIVWEKPVNAPIDSFKIYREIGLNNYVHIGSIAYSALSEFTDNTNGVNPKVQSYRYKISVLDTCGNESVLSSHHRTIHLATPQYTPPSTFDLIWSNDYEGFSISGYIIMRDGFSTGVWDSIGFVTYGNLSYTDINAPSASAGYIIEANHPAGCDATMKVKKYNASKSNTAATSVPVTVNEFSNERQLFIISPNPSGGKFSVIIYDIRPVNCELRIFNVLGEIVYSSLVIQNSSIEIDISKQPAGIYNVQVVNDKEIINKKIIAE